MVSVSVVVRRVVVPQAILARMLVGLVNFATLKYRNSQKLKVPLRKGKEVGLHGRDNSIQELGMVLIVATKERLSLIDVHGDTALSDQARLGANILQSNVQDVRQLPTIVLFSSLESEICC